MQKKAIFYDNNNNLCYAIIDISHSIITVNGYDEFSNKTSFLKMCIDENKFYIEVLICFHQYRNRGIATELLNIVEFILKDYNGFIYGEYNPYNDANISDKENDYGTGSFYLKNGYTIITKNEFLSNPDKYPELSQKYFEKTIEKSNNSIVFKNITKKADLRFAEEDNILIDIESMKNKMNDNDHLYF